MTGEARERRSYERTHSWLTFSFDLRRLKHTDWLALGECASLVEHIAEAPLDPVVTERINKIYLVRGALATTAIEGNTLTEDEVRSLIDGALTLPPSREYLGREIDNIVAAYNELIEELTGSGAVPLTVERIRRMNEAVLRDLEVDDYVTPGRIRETNVSVGGYHCPVWQDARFLLGRLCAELRKFPIPSEAEHAFFILKAVFAHLYLVWIHPFGDGNGRTARLIEFAILLEAGLPLPACHLLSDHYNRTRTEYYHQLARASEEENGIYGFTSYAIAGLMDGLREQIEVVREHQRDVAWINFVHERFRDIKSVTARRRRALALALPRTGEEIRIAELWALNPELAREYARLSYRTLFRDVAELTKLGLLTAGRERGAVRARCEDVLALRPWRHEPKPE